MYLKNYRRKEFLSKSIPDSENTRKLITEISLILNVKMSEEK